MANAITTPITDTKLTISGGNIENNNCNIKFIN